MVLAVASSFWDHLRIAGVTNSETVEAALDKEKAFRSLDDLLDIETRRATCLLPSPPSRPLLGLRRGRLSPRGVF